MSYEIRPVTKADDARIEHIIRSCLIEFVGNHPGTAWQDPDLGRFSEIYQEEGTAYWVAVDEEGSVVGGAGIGRLADLADICELQKMYCIPAARGTGGSHQLMDLALSFARKHYKACYLETLESMKGAQIFYEKYGFTRVKDALTQTGHDSCDVRYLKRFA